MFIKIHIPWDTLCKYAERLNIRMPFRYFQVLFHSISEYIKVSLFFAKPESNKCNSFAEEMLFFPSLVNLDFIFPSNFLT